MLSGKCKVLIRRWKSSSLTLILIFLLFCAKKMLPPSPDRFSPYLVEAIPRTRVQLELVFNEEIDSRRLVLDSFNSNNGLVLSGISQGRDRSRVILWTREQEWREYNLSGVVWDGAGNRGQFRTRFTGSTRIDTIPPRVVAISPEPGRVNVFRNIRLSVRFSEPVDTTLTLPCLFVPQEYEARFQRSWKANWQEVEFVYKDSIARGKEVYFILQPGVKDLEGNSTTTPAWTYFSPDSVFPGVRVRGRVVGQGKGGMVLFNKEQTRALAPILTDGSFEIKVRPGEYSVFAVSDTNGDGLIDLKTEVIEFNTMGESLGLFFLPETLPKSFNDYRY